MTISPDDLLDAIDRHLAAIPAGRSTVTVEEHRDVLLDLRLTVSGATPAETAPEVAATAAVDPEPIAEAAVVVDEPDSGFPDDFEGDAVEGSVDVDPALTGLDLAREITVPAEQRVDDFPDAEEPADWADEPAASTAAPEPEPEPAPERLPVVHLRLAASKLGVIARCGNLVDTDTGDGSTPWSEEVTCPECLDRTDDPVGDGAEETDAEAAAVDAAAPDEPADAVEPAAAPEPINAALPDDDGTEPSWIHDDGDEDDAPVVHQLAEVEGTGHGKNKIAKAKCGHVETVLKTDSFTETASWLEDVTCPDCIAARLQPADRSAAA